MCSGMFWLFGLRSVPTALLLRPRLIRSSAPHPAIASLWVYACDYSRRRDRFGFDLKSCFLVFLRVSVCVCVCELWCACVYVARVFLLPLSSGRSAENVPVSHAVLCWNVKKGGHNLRTIIKDHGCGCTYAHAVATQTSATTLTCKTKRRFLECEPFLKRGLFQAIYMCVLYGAACIIKCTTVHDDSYKLRFLIFAPQQVVLIFDLDDLEEQIWQVNKDEKRLCRLARKEDARQKQLRRDALVLYVLLDC